MTNFLKYKKDKETNVHSSFREWLVPSVLFKVNNQLPPWTKDFQNPEKWSVESRHRIGLVNPMSRDVHL